MKLKPTAPKNTNLFLWIVFVVAIIMPFTTSAQMTARQERNLTAFAKLYGYARYFYPGDEARQINWDQFAIYGSKSVLDQPNDKALINMLGQLYLPIASAIKIASGLKPIKLNMAAVTPKNPKQCKIVSWQHYSYGDGDYNPGYESIRLNRRDLINKRQEKADLPAIFRPIDVSGFSGKRFVLTVDIKVVAKDAGVKVKLLRDSFVYDRVLLKTYAAQTVEDTSERTLTFTGLIAKGTDKIDLTFYFDDNVISRLKSANVGGFHFYIDNRGSKTEIPLLKTQAGGHLPIQLGHKRYALLIDDDELLDKPLFAARTSIGESVQEPLVTEINCMVPLALYGDKNNTYPKADVQKLDDLKRMVEAIKVTIDTGDNAPLSQRLADVIITWNAFEHFFPYWDGASKTPQQILQDALQKTFTDKTSKDFFYTLKLICAALNDGHMFYNSPFEWASIPLVFTKAEGKTVIKAVLDTSLRRTISAGDIVETIEGKEALLFLKSKEQYLSGSTQCKERDALTFLANGKLNTGFTMVIQHGGNLNKVSLTRKSALVPFWPGSFSLNPLANGEIKKGLFYYNLGSDSSVTKKVEQQMDVLLKAKAIIFDMRGYPAGVMPLIQQLLTRSEDSKWIHTPLIIYPDHKETTYANLGWDLKPLQPHLTAKIFVLTDASTMSAAESYSGYFKDFKLATVIGQPTAGANGGIAVFKLPGVNDMVFSGQMVTNHDGSKHHLIGVVPDILVQPTIKAIKEGRDEVLERAVLEAKKSIVN